MVVDKTVRRRGGGPHSFKPLLRNWQLYLFVAPTIAYFLIFHYYPMYGLQIAFKDYLFSRGIMGSSWLGFDHFERFFGSYNFWRLIRNTLAINIYQLLLFPISVIVALSINELSNVRFKKWIQTITYAPHFISAVVMCGIIIAFLSPSSGIVNHLIAFFGFEPVNFMGEANWFWSIFVWSGEWQNLGWGAIIYLAALTGVNPQLHEAAVVDGATRFQRIWHINLPGIRPTIVILLILQLGNLMGVGFEKVFLLQNDLNISASEVIQTYVYKIGLLNGQYSFATAVGLFNAVINFIMLVMFNSIARRTTETSLW